MTRRRANEVRWAVALVVPALLLALSQAGQDAGEKGTPQQRRQSINNLKQIVLALHNYNDANKRLPAAAHLDGQARAQLGNPQLTAEQLAKAKGKPLPLLSWRVAILPYIEEDALALYRQFKLDQPWDSEDNKMLIDKMPKLYAPVCGKTKEPGMTYYQVFVGPEAPFNGTIAPTIPGSFTDGLSNTFLVVEAGEAVPWTKPQDIPYDAGKPLPKLGGLFADGWHVAMADGLVRFVPRGADEKAIRATITPRGGEVVELPGKEIKRED
jgi:hypothetical protein